jgi:IS605 OrfB family transposase
MPVKSIACKLRVNQESAAALDATFQRFNAACNRLSQIAWEKRLFRPVPLHREAYHAIRAAFELPAQLTVRAIKKVTDSYTRDRSQQHTFGLRSAVIFDARCFTLYGGSAASLTTVLGRYRFSLAHGGKQRDQLAAGEIGEADLLFRDGNYYLSIAVKTPDPPPADTSGGILGVDLGIVNLATDSDGTPYSGAEIQARRKQVERSVRLLQKAGTKSAKRHLKKIAKKRSRYRADTNHCIAKKIVATARTGKKALALEDLTGIGQRASTGYFNRAAKRELGKWAFRDLGEKIAYKAAEVGIPVVFVDPRNTSRTCHVCDYCDPANRKSQAHFHCLRCGRDDHADQNAARNIATRAAMSGSLLSQGNLPWNGDWSALGTSRAALAAAVT